MLPVFAIKHMVTSSVHADTLTIVACELLLLNTAGQLQSIVAFRTLGIPSDVPVVPSQSKGTLTGLGLAREIGPSILDRPFVFNVVELYPNTSVTDEENVDGNG